MQKLIILMEYPNNMSIRKSSEQYHWILLDNLVLNINSHRENFFILPVLYILVNKYCVGMRKDVSGSTTVLLSVCVCVFWSMECQASRFSIDGYISVVGWWGYSPGQVYLSPLYSICFLQVCTAMSTRAGIGDKIINKCVRLLCDTITK